MLRSLGILAFVGLLSCVLGAPTGTENKGQIWAVLVAGSNGYDNYRHQADICHAYQIFHRHGIPDSNIIVFMYDDIAHNADNPTKGVIINKPRGPNVYPGVIKDYTGDDVSPKNFYNVLIGNAKAMAGIGSGKVLKSGPDDHVFINFADHGATNLIAFPNDVMYARQLNKALKIMHKKKMYKKLVFYMEACESGSMFNKLLPSNIGIFATTAANPDQSSYAYYWDEKRQAYLGDTYSISWMEDIDSEEHHKNMTTETLLTQFNNVKKRVNESNPQMYGEKDLGTDHVADFLGKSKSYYAEAESAIEQFQDTVSSRDVGLETLRRKIELAKTEERKNELIKKRDELLKGRKTVDALFERILAGVTKNNAEDLEKMQHTHQSLSVEQMPCYETLVEDFRRTCVNINKNTYALGHLFQLANLCATDYTSTDEILKVFAFECSEKHRALNNVN